MRKTWKNDDIVEKQVEDERVKELINEIEQTKLPAELIESIAELEQKLVQHDQELAELETQRQQLYKKKCATNDLLNLAKEGLTSRLEAIASLADDITRLADELELKKMWLRSSAKAIAELIESDPDIERIVITSNCMSELLEVLKKEAEENENEAGLKWLEKYNCSANDEAALLSPKRTQGFNEY